MNHFEQLLYEAGLQAEPQRLIFVFLQPELADDFSSSEKERFHAGQGGALRPVMYVSKMPEELSTFADLIAESRPLGAEWQVVLAGALDGKGGKPPSEDEAEKAARAMIERVRSGADLSSFLAFDRDGDALRFEPR